MIKLEYMRQFLAVSKYNSLSEAAKVLHRSPSAVSLTLKLIEEQTGQQLFEGERKQILTPFGEFFHECSMRAVTEHEKSIDDISRYASGESGHVRLATVPSVATHLIPLVITELYRSRPNIQVDLRDIDSYSVARTVTEGSSDFGIASLSPRSVNLKSELLTEEPFVCLIPKGHALENIETPLTLDELASFPFIANDLLNLSNNPDVQKLVAGAHLKIRNVSSLLAFVEAGFGITLLPRMASSLGVNLIVKPLQDTSLKRQLYLLQSTNRSLSSAANAFIDEIHNQVVKINEFD
jgi:LysR family carnitine catabolism transcriptional activator